MINIKDTYLDDLTGFWLKQAFFSVMSDSEQHLAPLGITVPQFTILAMIDLNPGVIQSRLVEHLYIKRSTSSELIEKLVQGGLLIRKAIDRRSNGLYLTDRGEILLTKAKAIVQQHDHHATQNLTDSETKTLKKLLCKLSLVKT